MEKAKNNEVEGAIVKQGSCHCGSVQFEVTLPEGLTGLRRCNCSMCARRGAIVKPVPIEDFKIISGEEFLTLYEFNTRTAKHYFCSRCGIYTHHKMRSNPNQYSVNIACLEGVNPFDMTDIELVDGINHIADRK